MAGPAGHHLPPGEEALIDGVHHDHHLARRLLQLNGVGGIGFHRVVVAAVAVGAVQACGCGDETHRRQEFIDGDSAQHLHVLEGDFGHLVARDLVAVPRRQAPGPACAAGMPASAAPTRHTAVSATAPRIVRLDPSSMVPPSRAARVIRAVCVTRITQAVVAQAGASANKCGLLCFAQWLKGSLLHWIAESTT